MNGVCQIVVDPYPTNEGGPSVPFYNRFAIWLRSQAYYIPPNAATGHAALDHATPRDIYVVCLERGRQFRYDLDSSDDRAAATGSAVRHIFQDIRGTSRADYQESRDASKSLRA